MLSSLEFYKDVRTTLTFKYILSDMCNFFQNSHYLSFGDDWRSIVIFVMQTTSSFVVCAEFFFSKNGKKLVAVKTMIVYFTFKTSSKILIQNYATDLHHVWICHKYRSFHRNTCYIFSYFKNCCVRFDRSRVFFPLLVVFWLASLGSQNRSMHLLSGTIYFTITVRLNL
jgi:hypothetical protein